MRYWYFFGLVNIVGILLLLWSWYHADTVPKPISPVISALHQTQMVAALKQPQRFREAIDQLQTVDTTLQIDPKIYQAADLILISPPDKGAKELAKLETLCRENVGRLTQLEKDHLAQAQTHINYSIAGVVGWMSLNLVMASWAAFDHRKIKRQMEQLTDKLTLQQAELEGVRVNNRDRTLEAVQRSRENRKLTRELIKEREESELDGMTKAYTKKSGMQKLYRVMNQHLGRNPIGFAMADIDFFKKVNDSYGHPGGDKVIQKFAEIMMRNFRKHDDFLIRYGGEEFVIVFPNLPLKEMISVLRRIQTDVCAAQIYVKNLQGEEVLVASTILLGSSLTFSCGFAELSEVPSYEAALEMMKSRDFQEIDPEREEAVFECFSVLIEDIKTLADKRLYHAKQSGRNQVCGPEEAVIPQIESRFARAKEFKAS